MLAMNFGRLELYKDVPESGALQLRTVDKTSMQMHITVWSAHRALALIDR
jgi:hypothetical protein